MVFGIMAELKLDHCKLMYVSCMHPFVIIADRLKFVCLMCLLTSQLYSKLKVFVCEKGCLL